MQAKRPFRLGGPDPYIIKANFEDTILEEPTYSESEIVGGSIEVFENDRQAQVRKDYMDSFSGVAFMAEYSICPQWRPFPLGSFTDARKDTGLSGGI